MNEPSATSQRAAADHFRLVGELEARVSAHDSQLATMDERMRTYDTRAQQLQSQIARLAGISETTMESLNKVERFREEDNKDLRAALIDALTSAPRTNHAAWALGVILVLTIALVLSGHLS